VVDDSLSQYFGNGSLFARFDSGHIIGVAACPIVTADPLVRNSAFYLRQIEHFSRHFILGK